MHFVSCGLDDAISSAQKTKCMDWISNHPFHEKCRNVAVCQYLLRKMLVHQQFDFAVDCSWLFRWIFFHVYENANNGFAWEYHFANGGFDLHDFSDGTGNSDTI